MTTISRSILVGLVLVTGLLAGCQRPDMEEMMKAPQRPVQLDRLNAFVGTWEGEAEMTMPGTEEVYRSTATNTISWSVDNRYLMNEMEITMHNGEKMHAMELWTWDPQIKKYRQWWFDDWGGYGSSTVEYEADEDEWEAKGESHCMRTGHTSYDEMEMCFKDADSMEWTWTSGDALGLITYMEMKGTSRRK